MSTIVYHFLIIFRPLELEEGFIERVDFKLPLELRKYVFFLYSHNVQT